MENRFSVVWPCGRSTVSSTRLARRPDTLDGKVVAELWDWIFKGDVMFDAFETELTKRHPGIKFVNWREFGEIHGAHEKEVLASLPQRFKELGVDAVICGVAC